MHRSNFRTASAAAVVGAALLAIWTRPTPVAGAPARFDWPTISFDIQRTASNPYETTIQPGNVGQLQELWSFTTDGVVDTSPVVASNFTLPPGKNLVDIVYVGSEHGSFYALDARNGHLLWQKWLGSVQTACGDLPGGVFGITSAPVIDRASNRVFVAGGDGAIHALDLVTGAESVGWPVQVIADPTHLHVWSGLTLHNGSLYAETASYCDFTPYHGYIAQVNVASAALVSSFYPTGQNGPDGGAIWGWAGASIGAANDVFIATGNALPDSIQAYGYAEDVVRLTPALGVVSANHPPLVGPDVDFGSTPTLFQRAGCPAQLAVENKSGVLFIYNQDSIGQGPVQRLQLADVNGDEFVGNPAWSPSTSMLYVANSSDSNSAVAPATPVPGPYHHGMVALQEGSDCRFALAWQNTVGPSASVLSLPITANGVVYYGDGEGSQVLAFDAVGGQQLWASRRFGGPVFAEPIVVNGRLYAGAWDKKIHAFGLP